MAGASDTEDEKEEAEEQTQTGEDARPPAGTYGCPDNDLWKLIGLCWTQFYPFGQN